LSKLRLTIHQLTVNNSPVWCANHWPDQVFQAVLGQKQRRNEERAVVSFQDTQLMIFGKSRVVRVDVVRAVQVCRHQHNIARRLECRELVA
jgi:hypothetical protein